MTIKTITRLNEAQILENLSAQQNPFFSEYYAFYSTWYGGITKNPYLMLLPIDDHMVHRGDGVFEAMKAVGGSVYLMAEHLNRLMLSAETIALKSPYKLDEMQHVILETLKVANKKDALIRIYLSRGPGNFSINPYDSVGTQFYVVITQLHSPSAEQYAQGTAIGLSSIPAKDSWMARVKSCNYLPNVMMKKEAVDRGFDYVINLDEKGYIAEGSTENIMIVDAKGILVHPKLDGILKGTTMIRACELASEHGMQSEVRDISLEELKSAREAMMCGTSLDVLAVTEFEGEKIADGKPGPMAKKLRELILEDIKTGPKRTSF